MKIIGVDPGTLYGAVVLLDTSTGRITSEAWDYRRIKGLSQQERIREIADRIMVLALGADLIAHEMAIGAKFNIIPLASFVAVIQDRALCAGIPTLSVHPSKLKLFATGDGRAEKSSLKIAAYKEGIEFKTDHEADAHWIAKFGAASLAGGEGCLEYQKRALEIAPKKKRKVSKP